MKRVVAMEHNFDKEWLKSICDVSIGAASLFDHHWEAASTEMMTFYGTVWNRKNLSYGSQYWQRKIEMIVVATLND